MAKKPRCALMLSLFGIVSLACTERSAPPAFEPTHALECGMPVPCGMVSSISGDPAQEDPTQYSDAQACALAALADGSPALIHYSDGCEGSCYGEAILIRPDSSVLRQDYEESWDDPEEVDFDGIGVLFEDWTDAETCLLSASSFFESCLAAFDPSCVSTSAWFQDCGTPGVVTCGD